MEILKDVKLKVFGKLSPELKEAKQAFGAQNFDIDEVGDPEWETEIKEWFWQDPQYYVFAYLGDELVGMASLFLRTVSFDSGELKIAGLGGLTVSKQHRGEGVAKQLIEERLKLAREWGADIAFLNTDIHKLGGLFAKYKFVPLGRNYSFIGKSGQMHEDDSGMIAPILSEAKFKQVLATKEPLFVGESNV